jgi:hypothetical protein
LRGLSKAPHRIVWRRSSDQYAAIFQSVSDRGIIGRKAYSNAHLSRDGSVTINYLEHLPPENW